MHEAFWTALAGVAVVVLALQFLGLAVALRVVMRMMLRLGPDTWINVGTNALAVASMLAGIHFGVIHIVFWLQVVTVISGALAGVTGALVGALRARANRNANQVAHQEMATELSQASDVKTGDLAPSSTALANRPPLGGRVLFLIQSFVGTVAAAAHAVIIVYALLSLADKRDAMPMHLAIWMELGVIIAVPVLQTLTADLQMSLKENGLDPLA